VGERRNSLRWNWRRILHGVVLIVCALLPLHPLMHDHIEFHSSHGTVFDGVDDDHGVPHDHPVIGSAAVRVMPHVCVVAVCPDAALSPVADPVRGDRDVRSFGGIRSDDDVGWHVVLSTFLI